MNQIILKLDNYFKLNKLKLNTNKTKAMIIKNKNKQVDLNGIQLRIENQSIELVHELKYLGIIIDDELNFNKHIDYICKKASSKVGLLHRIKKNMKVENRICIYKTIIAPHFEYCPTILFLLNESQFERLQKIQNRAMRAVMNVNKRTSIRLMLETLEWLNVKQIVTMRTLQFIHKMATDKHLNI